MPTSPKGTAVRQSPRQRNNGNTVSPALKFKTSQNGKDNKVKSVKRNRSTSDDLSDPVSNKKPKTEIDVSSTEDLENIENIKPSIQNGVNEMHPNEAVTPEKTSNQCSDHEFHSPADIPKGHSINFPDPKNERCLTCRQFLNSPDLLYYEGHPQDSVEEFVALTHEKLALVSGDEGDITERPQTNITGFTVFDKDGHLVALDAGLIENDVRIYMSGYLKSICSDSSEIDSESVPVKDVGPIIEWWIHGFDGGSKNCITVSTEFGEYNLMNPSHGYTPLMNNLHEKILLSKVVVEYLEEYYYLQPTYEDLLEILRETIIPDFSGFKLTEETLHKHAQFVCDQLVSLEAEEDEEPLITLPCIRELIKLMGIKFGKRKTRKLDYKKVDKKAWTKATTTPLVRKTFEIFFTNQLDKTNKDLVLRRKRCGVCEACQLSDCGECTACRAMAKFGGHGRTKKACVRRLCPNMAVEQADALEPEDDDDKETPAKDPDNIDDVPVPIKLSGTSAKKITWLGNYIQADNTKVYYPAVLVDDVEYKIGDYVMVETAKSQYPSLVIRIVYMWKEVIHPKAGYFHGEIFIRASDTVLGEVGDPREVFVADRCANGAPFSSIIKKANVTRIDQPEDWFKLGGKEVEHVQLDDDGMTYFYKKFYERLTARFTDLPPDPECPNEARKYRFCPSCERKSKRESKNIPRVLERAFTKSIYVPECNRTEWNAVLWRDHEYRKGTGVFLKPSTFPLKNHQNSPKTKAKTKLPKVDESIYTEYYRKSDNNLRGSNFDTGEPFCVGHIAAVAARGEGPLISPQEIWLRVHVLYRPENTTRRFPQHEDLNVVYWTDEVREVPFLSVVGPCDLVYEKNIPEQESLQEWLEKDPCRFYFREAYNKDTGKFTEVPEEATVVGRVEQSKGKGRGKSTKIAAAPVSDSNNKQETKKLRPLRTLDVFAGCGGLSEGLHKAGVAAPKWAIENVESAAHAFSLNNRRCTVFNEDCNKLLQDVMSGETHSKLGLCLPGQGEVELLCGGPPCQGFSGMNRFNSREYSNFKNSLVVSLLSYCDYYRPKYFILENVRNFVAYKKGMVLKLTLRCLLDMGYQCTFGVLQAGNYGVPQTRRRLIILAAAPGFKLPLYPEPTNVFSRRACSLIVTIDGKRFVTNIQWDHSAPRRTCTIHDAMSDLPQIPNGANNSEIEYGSMPETYFQRLVRSKDDNAKLRDHICKNMAPLIQARIMRVPVAPGSDWRDLPNSSVTLADGSKCKVLQYRHHDKKNGRAQNGALRGVCVCATGKPCDPSDKQENTLIPWCLPHTGNRHNNWAGLYGRVSWTGYFSTCVTDPEPMGKQGRVLHPEQHRVVSVRECARSQGFPDTYRFVGSLQDKHRQIGNAVPPPLGTALGREIKKALSMTTDQKVYYM